MNERERRGIGFAVVVALVIVLFFFAGYNWESVRDLQRRIGTLEQKVK